MLLLLLACTGSPKEESGETATDSGDSADSADSVDPGESADTGPTSRTLRVHVTVDGEPAADTLVVQGGNPDRWMTDAAGDVTVTLDLTVTGEIWVLANHPEARVNGDEITDETKEPFLIELTRFDPSDNPEFVFEDPGEGERAESNSSQCLHCHETLHEGWYASPHRTSASNPTLHDLYQGIARSLDELACTASGGTWGDAILPGAAANLEACFVGLGVLPTLGATGGCADCHAPGIDGELGGRDLLDARDRAYDYGVHCSVCHQVERVDLTLPPGVAGALGILRPSEISDMVGTGMKWEPMIFGPYPDVINPRMGAVLRDELFHSAELCAGCHQAEQEVLVPGEAIDLARWPGGKLPVHTTYGEWAAGPMNPAAPCQSCHMPPLPDEANSAGLYADGTTDAGLTSGWERPPGDVRAHTWPGPRTPESGMLQLAATIDVAGTVADGVLTVAATVKNVGPGHAIPTGEPMRSILMTVEARCDGVALPATGGDVVPDFGGWLDRKEGGDWTSWPGAAVGDVIRVVARPGGSYDYVGHGPFGDGTFDAAAKGMPVESHVGEVSVTAVDGDTVTLSGPLPAGDIAYRVRGSALAGAPGFGFARVMVGADGARMVPHFAAVDVASDNRLLPQHSWTSTHTFATTCEAPTVHATLVHRNFPLGLATERGWTLTDQVMAEVTR